MSILIRPLIEKSPTIWMKTFPKFIANLLRFNGLQTHLMDKNQCYRSHTNASPHTAWVQLPSAILHFRCPITQSSFNRKANKLKGFFLALYTISKFSRFFCEIPVYLLWAILSVAKIFRLGPPTPRYGIQKFPNNKFS